MPNSNTSRSQNSEIADQNSTKRLTSISSRKNEVSPLRPNNQSPLRPNNQKLHFMEVNKPPVKTSRKSELVPPRLLPKSHTPSEMTR